MHDQIPCGLCGGMIGSHIELFAEHLHPIPTAAELKASAWKGEKAWNHFRNKLERVERGGRWKPPLQRLVNMKLQVRYVG